MELSREPGVALVADTLVGAVVHIYEERLPVGRQSSCIYGIAMILGSNEALGAAHTLNGLVVTAVTVLQLVCLGTGGTSQQLVTQANAHTRTHSLTPSPSLIGEGSSYFFQFSLQECTDMSHRHLALFRVSRTIGQEKAIELQLIEVIVPRNAENLYPSTQQASDDVGLHAAID